MQEVMLAVTYSPELVTLPIMVTPKIDGIRFYVEGDYLWSRSNKGIPNLCLQKACKGLFPDGIDGELCVDQDFGKSSSLVMSHGEPLEDRRLTLFLFDLFSPEKHYVDRIHDLNEFRKQLVRQGWAKSNGAQPKAYFHAKYPFAIEFVFPQIVSTFAGIETYYSETLQKGFEGIILRVPNSKYKFGRSSDLLKYKPFIDREARIIGFEEMMHNTNPAEVNELGLTSRSTSAEGKVGAGVLGAFHVRDVETEVEFKVGNGPGLTYIVRADLWDKRHMLTGLIIKYQSMAFGEKEKPRHPKFLGFRDGIDM